MPTKQNDDQYPEAEAQQRFMAALKAAVNTPPAPLKSIPRKRVKNGRPKSQSSRPKQSRLRKKPAK
jgi:hypothetical protein